jgi:hypothetical protein
MPPKMGHEEDLLKETNPYTIHEYIAPENFSALKLGDFDLDDVPPVFDKDFVEEIGLSDYFEAGFFNLNYDWRKQGFDYDKATEVRNMELRDSLLKIDIENATYADKPYKGSFVYDHERKTVRRNHAG